MVEVIGFSASLDEYEFFERAVSHILDFEDTSSSVSESVASSVGYVTLLNVLSG
jgi:hypothetical protein